MIFNHTSPGLKTVTAVEAPEHILGPAASAGRQLKHCAIVIRSTVLRSAVEVTTSIDNDSAERPARIGLAFECVKQAFPPATTPFRCQLEYGATPLAIASSSAASTAIAIEFPPAVESYTVPNPPSAPALPEGVKHFVVGRAPKARG